jgi:hypothetical protein
MEEMHSLKGRPEHILLPEKDDGNEEMPFYGRCQFGCGECCVTYPYQIV